LRHNRTKEAGT